MIKLTDTELDQVFRAAGPLPVADRDRFLQAVAERLCGASNVGPGAVYRVCHELQKEFMSGHYPDLSTGHWQKWRRLG
jgi:hypothetical protein